MRARAHVCMCAHVGACTSACIVHCCVCLRMEVGGGGGGGDIFSIELRGKSMHLIHPLFKIILTKIMFLMREREREREGGGGREREFLQT